MPALARCFALLLVTIGAAAPVPQLALASEAKAKLSRDDPDRVVCRRESVTGYLAMTKKVCMTRAQWTERSRNAQEVGQRMQEAGLVNSCGALEPGKC